MLKQEIINLSNAIDSLPETKNTHLNYAISKNRRLIKGELSDLAAVVKPNPEFEKYDKERIEICKKFSKKDDSGEPIILNGLFHIDPSFQEELNTKLLDLKQLYKEAIEEENKKNEIPSQKRKKGQT
jgi:hypothetical protein